MTKKELIKYLNKPVMLSYYWNGAMNKISCKIIEVNYRLKYRKLDSSQENYVRYKNIDDIKEIDIKRVIMNETELRVGNWGDPYKPYQITAEDIYMISKGEKSIPVIELTEEWLIKAKFTKQKPFGVSNIWSIKIKGYWYSVYKKDSVWYLDINLPVVIKSLSHLQNIIYDLTNEELNIKL